jgi:hypothetical protein
MLVLRVAYTSASAIEKGRKMRRAKHLSAIVALAAILVSVLVVSSAASASTPPTVGTWYSHPAQTFTTSTTTTTGTTYKSAVRAPINADGSSNWPAKRGVIPVQFDLLAAPTTFTTTTKTYDPPVWQSLQADGSVSWAQLCLQKDVKGPGTCPDAPATSPLTFNDITNLSATYDFTTGDCRGGSLRWTIYVQHGSSIQSVHVYYGTPNGPDQGCSGANSGSGQNLITTGITEDRFEFQGAGAPVYTTYAAMQAFTNGGTDKVVAVQLTLDSGWGGDQVADVSDVTVNDNTWVPKTTEVTTTPTTVGDYAKTCDLPAAELRWAKNDNSASGAINEAESIQPKDTGQYYRQVDCKYIYNLDVSSLNGVGTYKVWVNVNGQNIQVPATFDLK